MISLNSNNNKMGLIEMEWNRGCQGLGAGEVAKRSEALMRSTGTAVDNSVMNN